MNPPRLPLAGLSPIGLFIVSALLVAALPGCDEPPGSGPCGSSAECDPGEVCIDGVCQLGTDGGRMDGGGGEDAGGRDASRPDTGPPGPDSGLDASCGGGAIPVGITPPNVLIVFDRSCSMRRRLDATMSFGSGPEDPMSRWYIAREAVRQMTTRYPGQIRWGISVYPDPREGCGMPVTVEIPPAPLQEMAVYEELLRNRNQPFNLCGLDNSDTTTQPRDTPTHQAVSDAMMLAELRDDARDNFIILLTDGGESCETTTALADLGRALVAAGIPAAVVGFSTGSSEASLEALASNAGLPAPGAPPSYYVADDAASLDAALDGIVRATIRCTIELGSVPPDPSMLYVYLNDVELANDPVDGWTYDEGSNSITLHGASCEQLRSGMVRRFNVSFGCPIPECVPQTEVGHCDGLDNDCDDNIDEDCLI